MATRSLKPVQGALLLALSALLFSLMGVLIREVSSTAGNEAVVFFRNLIGVLAFLPLVLFKGVAPLHTRRLNSHLWRSGFGLLAMYCFFYAIAHLPLADAMVFTYSAPVFTPLIAWWWLKEPLTRRMQITSLVGFAGVLLVAKKRMALKNLQEQFRERDTDKVYLALVAGHWPERLKVLDQPLQKMLLDGGERRVRIVEKDHPQAMRAVTLVKDRFATA